MTQTFDDLADLLGATDTPAAASTTPTDSSTHYSEGELANLLDVSTRWLRDLVAEGVLTRIEGAARVSYAPDQVTAYCRYIRAKAGTGADALKVAKLRAAEADAETREMKAAKMRGDLVSVSEISAKWAEILADVRATLLAVPASVAAEHGHLQPGDIAAIDRQLKRALERLSDDVS